MEERLDSLGPMAVDVEVIKWQFDLLRVGCIFYL